MKEKKRKEWISIKRKLVKKEKEKEKNINLGLNCGFAAKNV